MKKSKSRKSFCVCFEEQVEPDFMSHRKDYNGMKNESNYPIPVCEGMCLNVPVVLEKNSSKSRSSKEKTSRSNSKKKKAQRILSKIIRAVLFDTFLKKKIGNKKVRQDPLRSENSVSWRNERISDARSSRILSKEEEMKIDATIFSSHRSSLSFSSNSTLSLSSSRSNSLTSSRFSSDRKKSFRSNSFEIKPNLLDIKHSRSNNNLIEEENQPKKLVGKIITRSYNSINGLYLVLMSLLILILWGKVCAIICTSTWVYFVPGIREEEDVLKEKGKLQEEEKESKEYRKRVIMEGLLERNHHSRGN